MLKYLPLALVACCATTFADPLDPSQSCNLNQPSAGSKFAGHDVEAIFRAVQSAGGKKDEFESTSQYEQRRASALRESAGAVIDGALCIVTTEKATYDADTQRYWIPLLISHSQVGKAPSPFDMEYRVFIREHNRKESSYRARNAYGVTAAISKTTRDATHLVLPSGLTRAGVSALGGTDRDGRLALPLPMDGERAKALRNRIGLAVRYRLVDPMSGERMVYEMPKVDMPIEWTERQSVVFAQINQAAAYDRDTGEILGTFDFPARSY